MNNQQEPTTGERVMARRKELGYSRARAQEISGVDYKTWARIEEGKVASSFQATKDAICMTLGWKPGTFENPVLDDRGSLEDRIRNIESELEFLKLLITKALKD